ncbi:hypothetical protein QWY90_13095 [Flavobacterium paronense]|uniref:YD repeat-containing protein n=1 Tax=Flavobacterium paronense TaxID=1392775 RepID=A0ABV5GE66_9FLAO|nr:hypothetical protein [Flavobacterium paronense]MDN3678244.1 hypothetical protein [Flavobacterium paronense]
MKKLALLSLLFVVLQSCSSGDSTTTPPDEILVKKIVDTDPAGVFTTNYTYNGKKIVEAVLSTTNYIRRGVYTYTGDVITKIEYFDIDNTLTGSNVYNFNTDNRLESTVKLNYSNGTGTREVYTYTPDGNYSTIVYSGDLTTQNTVVSHNSITMSNGSISSRIEDTGTVIKTNTYVYDTKNSPFKNVIGFEQQSHNQILWNYSENGGAVSTTEQHYTYNANDFPVSHYAGTNTSSILRYYY